MKFSVVVVAYRRIDTLAGILSAWLGQSSDVWLADCSPGGAKDVPAAVHHVRFHPDPGNVTRHVLALLTENEWVVKADDDFLPGPRLLGDFMNASGPDRRTAFWGIMGRRFEGPKYYGNTISARANKITEPARVDFVGICTMAPRAVLAFDPRGCLSSIEDLFHQCGAFPEVPKFVFPSTSYSHIPGADRPGCLCKNPKAQVEREIYYSKVWERCRAIRLGEGARG